MFLTEATPNKIWASGQFAIIARAAGRVPISEDERAAYYDRALAQDAKHDKRPDASGDRAGPSLPKQIGEPAS